MKLSQLKIDPEFQSKIPPLQFEEEQQLEQNIIAEGRLLNPIITWNGYILDGHTRYRILKKHGFIKFEVEEIQLANKYEALAWICKNQLGRRNLSPERKKFLLGKEYESTKLAVGGQPGNCNKVNRCDQNDHIDSEKRTCERITVEHGVGSATVRRAEKYGAAYRLGTGWETPCGSSAEQHWKPSFAYIDRCNCYHPDGKEEKPAHPCAGGFQPGL